MQSHRKGDLTEAILIAELKRRSIPVSVPFGENERYDLVVETPQAEVLRVQVKTGWLEDDTIEFHAKSQHTNSTGNVYKNYEGEVDYFLVHCHELDTSYLIGEHEFGRSISLRVTEPKVANRRVNWATDYELDARWPPEKEPIRKNDRTSVEAVIEASADAGATVATPIDDPLDRIVVDTGDDQPQWVRVKSGWIDNGCIRYNHEIIPEKTAYLALYVSETESCYLVPRDDFESSITLRIEPVQRDDDRINWAIDYAFPENTPWC